MQDREEKDKKEEREGIKSLCDDESHAHSVFVAGTPDELQALLKETDQFYQDITFEGKRIPREEAKHIFQDDLERVLVTVLERSKPVGESVFKIAPPILTPFRIPQLRVLFDFAVHQWGLTLEKILAPYLSEMGDPIRDEEIELGALLLSYGASKLDLTTQKQISQVILNADEMSVKDVLSRMSNIRKRLAEVEQRGFKDSMELIVARCFSRISSIEPEQIPSLRLLLDFIVNHNLKINYIDTILNKAILENNLAVGALMLSHGAEPKVDSTATFDKFENFIADALKNASTSEDIKKYLSDREETKQYLSEFKHLSRDTGSVINAYLFGKPEVENDDEHQVPSRNEKESKLTATSQTLFQAKPKDIKDIEVKLVELLKKVEAENLSIGSTPKTLLVEIGNWFQAAVDYVKLLNKFIQSEKGLSQFESKEGKENRLGIDELQSSIIKGQVTIEKLKTRINIDSHGVAGGLDVLFDTLKNHPQCPPLLRDHILQMESFGDQTLEHKDEHEHKGPLRHRGL